MTHLYDDEAFTMTRRELLAAATALTVMAGVPASLLASVSQKGNMPYRTLGRTGEKVSLIGIGGAHLGRQSDENTSIRIIRTAIDNGVNFLDNSCNYHNGKSEIRMGKALLDGYRQKAFLMTKIDGRDKETASKQLEESLRRFQTDRIDLIQFHEIMHEGDPQKIFGPGGAMETVQEARKAGKIRYIGFTGHKSPAMHLDMLDVGFQNGFTFDAVQMPLNVMDAHYDSFEKKVLPVLLKHNIGVLGMKPFGHRAILRSNTVSAMECLHYAMALPTSVVITGCDSLRILRQALNAANSFKPLREEDVTALLAKTADAAKEGEYELYKTTRQFDSTYHNPEWLGPQNS